MGKQKFDRMKIILGILMLVFAVVPLITVSASAQNSNTSSVGPMVGPMVGPFGYYPPAPYGDSGDSEVVCGPYGCYWNEATAYLPKAVIAEQGW
jgi:hypothetical protein